MEQENKNSILPTVAVILIIVAILIGDWATRNKINKLEKITQKDIQSIKQTQENNREELDLLRTKVTRLSNENIELWFSNTDPEIKKNISTEIENIGCPYSEKGIQNTYYGKLELIDFGYIRYTFPMGIILYDKNGKQYCFNYLANELEDCKDVCPMSDKELEDELIDDINELIRNEQQ